MWLTGYISCAEAKVLAETALARIHPLCNTVILSKVELSVIVFIRLLTLSVIISAFIPLIRTDAWWVRSFDFPRAQFATVGILTAVSYLFVVPLSIVDHSLIVLLVFSILLQAYRIFPYTSVAPKKVENATRSGQEISIISANVLQSNRKAAKLLDLISEKMPDIVLVIETNAWWEQALASLEEAYPSHIKHPLDNTYGMLLYSKFTIKAYDIRFLLEEYIPSIFATIILPSGTEIEIIGVHPKPPRPDKMQDATERDAELLIVAKHVADRDLPIIVMGDFNDVAWSHTTRLFQRMSGLLDPRKGRGLYNTYHADYPFYRFPLDHIFHSKHFRIKVIERLAHIGSDHFPVYAALSLENDAGTYQDEPHSAEQDEEEAKRMIRQADV